MQAEEILWVDDASTSVDDVGLALEEVAKPVAKRASAVEAIQYLRERSVPPKVIVLDYILPVGYRPKLEVDVRALEEELCKTVDYHAVLRYKGLLILQAFPELTTRVIVVSLPLKGALAHVPMVAGIPHFSKFDLADQWSDFKETVKTTYARHAR